MNVSDILLCIMNTVPSAIAKRFNSDGLLARTARPILNIVLPKKLSWVSVRSGPVQGIWLQIYPRSEKLFWPGMHEPNVQKALVDILKPGMTVWDVGAHIGFFSFLCSRFVGETGRVLAFEPVHETRERLRAAVIKNGVQNLSIFDCALGLQSGITTLHARGNSAMWTLVPEKGDIKDTLAVSCRTVDELVQTAQPPDLIKIDAEGAEIDVLRGGVRFLSTHRPKIVIETEEDMIHEVHQLLPDYSVDRLGPRHWLIQ